MKHFLLPESSNLPGELKLAGRDFHYLVKVLRKRKGDRFIGMDKRGRHYFCTVSALETSTLTLNATASSSGDGQKPDTRITLYQCIPKGKKMDLIIRQAVESGVTVVVPVISSRSVPRFKEADRERKRWVRISEEALQQSGADVPLTINEITALTDIHKTPCPGDIKLFFHQEPIAQKTLHQYLSVSGNSIDIVIGPEGGFSDDEVIYLKEAGFEPAYLGSRVLKVETAALCVIASIQIILLEYTSWKIQ